VVGDDGKSDVNHTPTSLSGNGSNGDTSDHVGTPPTSSGVNVGPTPSATGIAPASPIPKRVQHAPSHGGHGHHPTTDTTTEVGALALVDGVIINVRSYHSLLSVFMLLLINDSNYHHYHYMVLIDMVLVVVVVTVPWNSFEVN
jgi:hypothetical protein